MGGITLGGYPRRRTGPAGDRCAPLPDGRSGRNARYAMRDIGLAAFRCGGTDNGGPGHGARIDLRPDGGGPMPRGRVRRECPRPIPRRTLPGRDHGPGNAPGKPGRGPVPGRSARPVPVAGLLTYRRFREARSAEPDIAFGTPVAFRHVLPVPGVGERLPGRFRNPRPNPIRGRCAVVVPPVAHPIIGCRRLRDTDACRDDGTVGRIAGPRRSPDVSAVGPRFAGPDGRGVAEVRSELDSPVMGHMVRGGRGRHPITADRCRAPVAMPEEPQRAPTGKGGVCTTATPSSAPSPGPTGSPTSPIVPETSATPAGPTSPSTAVRAEHADAFPAQGPGPASTAPSPTNHRRTTAFVEGRMRRPAAVRSKAENDGAARRREPITSKPVGSRSRGMPAVASYPPETRSGANANRRSGPGRSGPLDRVRIRGHRRQRANGPA